MSLDLAVSRALRCALVMERALHEPQGWSFLLGDLSIPAVRELDEYGVTFHATTPDLTFVENPDVLTLCLRGEDQLVRVLGTDEVLADSELFWRLEMAEVARI